MRSWNAQRGDTIVEVLIAIAVASSVLAVIYSTMNRNLLITRDTQERAEATKIVQGQMELLKAHVDNGDVTVNNGTFCLDASSPTAVAGFTGTPTNTLPEDFSHYPANCKGKGLSGLYNIAVVANSGLYKIYVRWDNVQGTGTQDQVVMVYKI